ncbi:MAG: NB-ARC domain-containing protein [Chloroflexota bacterium]|nr:NB-ARC domain-containing protein [Chloroflexota bacterium]
MSAGDRGGERAGHRLLIPLSRFVGREEELATLTSQLRDPAVRLISVTGPGGVGKTRLVTQAALSLEPEFAGRIAIIRLDDITDRRDVLPTIARAIGADDGQRGPREALIRLLGDDRWLLVLDNFEHLLSAASDVATLLQHAAGTTVLVTTRARLQVAGEHVLPLAPLPVPPANLPAPIDLDHFASTRLFVDRAHAADARFSATGVEVAIAAICRRLEGLPLAIELAAARVAIMPPAALLEQLDAGSSALSVLRGGPRDNPSRLQTVEAAIIWSYDLLWPIEQAFFRRMSVFVGGFTLSWAAAMIRGHEGGEAYPIDAGVDPRLHWWFHHGRDLHDTSGRRMDAPPLPALALDPMDAIQSLLDGSLLQTVPGGEPNQPRYQMLDSIRSVGVSRLAASAEEEAVRVNHAALILGFVELTREEMWNAPQPSTPLRLERELGNIRAVLTWAARSGPAEAELALRLPQSLWLFWQTRGYVTEGRSWLDRALALDAGPAWDRAAARIIAGLFAWIQSDLDRAESALAEARAFWQTTDNKHYLGESILFTAAIAWTRGDVSRLVTEVETALPLYRDWGAWHGLGICLILLAIVAHRTGQSDRALVLLDEARVTCDAASFFWGSACSTLYAADIERDRGNDLKAATLSIEALSRFWADGDPWGAGAAMSGIALLAAGNGDTMLAARLLGASAALRERAAAFLPVISPETFADAETQVRKACGSELFERAYAEGWPWSRNRR